MTNTISESIINQINKEYPYPGSGYSEPVVIDLRKAAEFGYGLGFEELGKWIDNEIATAKSKLDSLSPLGRHALQAPIKAQIALMEEIKLKFLPNPLCPS